MKDPMELVDRYLQAVGFWLPKKQRQDILNELSEDLRSQIEEKETELGRKLKEPDIEYILKLRGRPVLVANRYLPQQYLIGPLLFPIYRFVLMIVGLCYLVPWIIVAIVLAAFTSTYAQAGWMKELFKIWSSFWGTAFITVGIVTMVFAVMERVNAKSGFMEEWEPKELPAVRDPRRIPRSASTVELAVMMAFCVWWVGYMASPLVINRPDVRILLLPAWRYFFWGVLLVMLVNIPLSAVNLFRPYWTRLRASLRLATDLAGSALICWVLTTHMVVEITVAKVPPEKTAQVTSAINLWMGRSVPIAIIVGVAILVFNAIRIARIKSSSIAVTAQAVAVLH